MALAGGACGGHAVSSAGSADASALDGDDSSAPVDASVDAPEPSYHEIADSTRWSTFDLAAVDARAWGFHGGAFDGRYLYFSPYRTTLVARLDTRGQFADAASWATFDLVSVYAGAQTFFGAVFDGRYVYFVPNTTSMKLDGTVVRFDTKGDLRSIASWTKLDISTIDSKAAGFAGAVFDGRYVYFSEYASGAFARLDTTADFTMASSWSIFDYNGAFRANESYQGGIFDGRYVYFVPWTAGFSTGGRVARVDTQAPFDAKSSWSSFDVSDVRNDARGYFGGAFDGKALYLVPFGQGSTMPQGIAARFDIAATFTNHGSWTFFDTSTLDPNAVGFAGAAYDGRYAYYAPTFNAAGASGLVVRVDARADFTMGGSWGRFDLAKLNPAAKGYIGALFDGRYVYFVPAGNGVVARFDAKDPPSMPPGYRGSFL